MSSFFACSFFFNNPTPIAIYTLSLHDALPISFQNAPELFCLDLYKEFDMDRLAAMAAPAKVGFDNMLKTPQQDRKSTRLNSSHTVISYAVFCLKKKNKQTLQI